MQERLYGRKCTQTDGFLQLWGHPIIEPNIVMAWIMSNVMGSSGKEFSYTWQQKNYRVRHF
jgi:hypothetical protein